MTNWDFIKLEKNDLLKWQTLSPMYLSLHMACELHWKGRDFSPPSGVVANLTSEPFICKTLERSWSVIEA